MKKNVEDLELLTKVITSAKESTDIFHAHFNRSVDSAKLLDIPNHAHIVHSFKYMVVTTYYLFRKAYGLTHEEAIEVLQETCVAGATSEQHFVDKKINKREATHES
jgi:hypothetical protein